MIRQRDYDIGPRGIAACSVAFEISRESQLSSQKVTGPSLVNDTCMWAPKTPVSTRPCRARAACTKTSNKRCPCSAGAAVENPGRRPRWCLRSQSELRHQQQAALNLGQAQVHFPRLVGEYAVLQQAVEKAQSRRLIVGGLHADQNQQAGIDGGDLRAVDKHLSLKDPLQKADPSEDPLATRVNHCVQIRCKTPMIRRNYPTFLSFVGDI